MKAIWIHEGDDANEAAGRRPVAYCALTSCWWTLGNAMSRDNDAARQVAD